MSKDFVNQSSRLAFCFKRPMTSIKGKLRVQQVGAKTYRSFFLGIIKSNKQPLFKLDSVLTKVRVK